jgi:hypothetical protein
MEQFKFSNASTFFSERPLLTLESTLAELVPSFDSSLLEAILTFTLSRGDFTAYLGISGTAWLGNVY